MILVVATFGDFNQSTRVLQFNVLTVYFFPPIMCSIKSVRACVYGRDKLMASPLVAARLHYRDLITVSGLGLAGHRRWRGCRGGADANRSRLFKCWPQFGLANARSVVNKCAMVHDLIVSSQLDLLAITETWLSSRNGVTCLEACSPEGYFSTHVPRMGRRGGGVALVYKDTILSLHSNYWTSPSR